MNEQTTISRPAHDEGAVSVQDAVRSVQSYIRLPFITEQWYVAGLAEEFTEELIEKTILGKSLVMFRRQDGTVAALSNRCPHRAFPMAQATLTDDVLKCSYHGARFDAHGKPVSVPCQTAVPKVGLRKYPTHQTGPLVWIWTGEGDGDISKIPEMDCLVNDGWVTRVGSKPTPGNYLLMQDNLSDLSHLPFLHGDVMPLQDALAEAEMVIDVDEDAGTVTFYREFDNFDDVAVFYPPEMHHLSGRKIRQHSGGAFVSPGVFRGGDTLELLDAKEGEQTTYRNFYIHYLTPETMTATHYYFAVARDYALENENFTTMLMLALNVIFQQDVEAVRHMQRLIDMETDKFNDLRFSGDKASLAVRKIIANLAVGERDAN